MPASEAGAQVSAVSAAGLVSVRLALCVPPFSEAVMDAVSSAENAPTVAEN